MPLAAQAADLLDRDKAASQMQAEKMLAFMISRLPELEGVIPPTEWTAGTMAERPAWPCLGTEANK